MSKQDSARAGAAAVSRRALFGHSAALAGIGIGVAAAGIKAKPAWATQISKIGFDHPFNTVPLWSTIMKLSERAAKVVNVELLIAVDDATNQAVK